MGSSTAMAPRMLQDPRAAARHGNAGSQRVPHQDDGPGIGDHGVDECVELRHDRTWFAWLRMTKTRHVDRKGRPARRVELGQQSSPRIGAIGESVQ
jgi:hypothetical protein